MREHEVLETLQGLGFGEADARTLADHFVDAERRGKTGHGLSRVEWLATRPFELDPSARPRCVLDEPGYQRWDANGALGYLTLASIVEAQVAEPPQHARLVVAQRTFPTGMLGYINADGSRSVFQPLADGIMIQQGARQNPPSEVNHEALVVIVLAVLAFFGLR